MRIMLLCLFQDSLQYYLELVSVQLINKIHYSFIGIGAVVGLLFLVYVMKFCTKYTAVTLHFEYKDTNTAPNTAPNIALSTAPDTAQNANTVLPIPESSSNSG